MNTTRQSRTAILLASLLTSGCMVGPDYQRPDVSLPQAYPEAAPEQTDRTQEISDTWWTLFNDPALNELVEKALRDNAELARAVARIEESEAVLRQAGAALYPELGLGSSATRRKASSEMTNLPAGASRTGNSFELAATTAFELDFWGRLRRASEAARAQALASVFAKETVELALVSGVTQAYLNLRALDAQVVVSRETLKTRERTQDLVEKRRQGGIASPLEVEQAEIARAGAAAQLSDLVRQRALVQHQLAVLAGDVALKVPEEDLRNLLIPPVPPVGMPSELLNERPDIRQAEAQLASTNALIGVAKAALFPSISLTGAFGGQSRELSDLFDDPARFWSLGGALDLPLFDAGRRSARVDEVSAVQRQALANYVQTVRVGFQEVNDALVNLHQTAVTEEALAAQLAAAKRAVEIAEIRYTGGYSGFLEVLDVQRSANNAELQYIQNRQQRLVATISLIKALGGGWKEAAATNAP